VFFFNSGENLDFLQYRREKFYDILHWTIHYEELKCLLISNDRDYFKNFQNKDQVSGHPETSFKL